MKKDLKECNNENCSELTHKKYCSKSCYANQRKVDSHRKKEKLKQEQLNDTYNYVKCELCGEPVKAIAGHIAHKKDGKHGINLKEYRRMFPNAPIIAPSTSKILSEQNKGENNANHHSKTSKEYRQSLSPFSIKFYERKFPNESKEFHENKLKQFVNDFDYENRLTESNLEYWIEKTNGDVELAEKLYKDRQSTFSKEKCISKYGEEKGIEVWNNRQKKWKEKILKNFIENGDGRNIQSGIAKELIDDLYEYVNVKPPLKEKFIYDNYEKYGNGFSYDFCYKNKIIEFHGDYWHCNPNKYKSDYYHTKAKKFAHELWVYDKYKIEVAKRYNYDVLVIWENDYRTSKEDVLRICKEFIGSN